MRSFPSRWRGLAPAVSHLLRPTTSSSSAIPRTMFHAPKQQVRLLSPWRLEGTPWKSCGTPALISFCLISASAGHFWSCWISTIGCVRHTEVNGARWPSRSSKPVAARVFARGLSSTLRHFRQTSPRTFFGAGLGGWVAVRDEGIVAEDRGGAYAPPSG